MPTPSLSYEDCKWAFELVDSLIQNEGFKLGKIPSPVEEAARRANINSRTFRSRYERALSLYGFKHGMPIPAAPEPVESPEAPPPPEPDKIEIARHKAARDAAIRERDEAVKRAVEAENVREFAFGLARELRGPAVIIPPRNDGRGGHRSAILHISDVHMGEVVSLYEMDGLNSYDPDICEARLDRLFAKAASLLTEHWAGSPVEELIIVLGGDMVNGEHRDEAAATNALPVTLQVTRVAEKLAGGLLFLQSQIGAPMRVYTTPGNHGRLYQKPRVKQHAIDSYDTMVSWSIEKIIGRSAGIPFYYTGSGEALFNVYGWWFLAQHGHMGTGGTGGVYGPVYKQVRGMYKTHQTYARRRRAFDWVLQGHDHTTTKIPFGIASGSLVGFNEYASHKLKADPEPAKQNLIVVEQDHGIINHMELYLGVPEEGDLYIPPELPEATEGKQRVRVPAWTRRAA